ncbi:MAG: hypothetical protein N2490_01285 [Ignavibacteria bacterium]|nr:hypothetical protein [Ignavibacteria bacterium]
MRKLRFLLLSIIIILSINLKVSGQASSFSDVYTIEVEVFMGMLDGIFSDDMIDEITYFLPEHLYIINFNIGDFSGDGLNDIVISYNDETCKKNTYKVLLLINDEDTFIVGGVFQYGWYYTPYDISFSIKDNICYISHIEKGKWVFTGFSYKNDKLVNVVEEYF